MSDQSPDSRQQASSRRRLLKALTATGSVVATGALVPREWISPVVKSVALPAHAQTSPSEDDDDDVVVGNFGAAAAVVADNRSPSILDLVVSRAYGGGSATVGNVTFDAFYTVGRNSALVCGWADFENTTTTLGALLDRNGNSLSDYSEDVDGATLRFTNQRVRGGGVSLDASANMETVPLFAPRTSTSCGDIINSTMSAESSSPYADDEGLT